jgi:NADPH:quinone reductase-like Zn-dependent oxidoreductase
LKNPTDYKHASDNGATSLGVPEAVLGNDFCGTVISIAADVTLLKIGDRVASTVHGGKFPATGAFAQYLKVPQDMCWKVPDDVKGPEASTFGIGFQTAAMVRHRYIQLEELLSYSASSTISDMAGRRPNGRVKTTGSSFKEDRRR